MVHPSFTVRHTIHRLLLCVALLVLSVNGIRAQAVTETKEQQTAEKARLLGLAANA